MNKYYISLVNFFRDYYICVYSEDENYVRMWANKVMPGMWCSVYSEDEIEKISNKWGWKEIKSVQPVMINEYYKCVEFEGEE